jgi:hypothetical protein
MLKRADWRALQEAPDASQPDQLELPFSVAPEGGYQPPNRCGGGK